MVVENPGENCPIPTGDETDGEPNEAKSNTFDAGEVFVTEGMEFEKRSSDSKLEEGNAVDLPLKSRDKPSRSSAFDSVLFGGSSAFVVIGLESPKAD